MIFGTIKNESILQVKDKTRIDVKSTFISPDEEAITKLEIEPEATAGYIDVTSSKQLDWSYATAGDKTISLRVTTDSTPEVFTSTVKVLTAEDDRLFSSDADLVQLEDDILNYVRKGRDSFLDKHREAQYRILDQLDMERIYDIDGKRLKAINIANLDEVRQWSKYLTAQIIYESLVSEVDDVFQQKAAKYEQFATKYGNRAALSIRQDLNKDGSFSELETEKLDVYTTRMMRR